VRRCSGIYSPTDLGITRVQRGERGLGNGIGGEHSDAFSIDRGVAVRSQWGRVGLTFGLVA
jgi:hypothetical protein